MIPLISTEEFDAVLFDLDGVLTQTAKIHGACWKKMFDEFLKTRSEKTGEAVRPFDIDEDYKIHVDGKLRSDGVRSFLHSRGIELPLGAPDDPPERETISGLGNRKNLLVREAIVRDGVDLYDSSIDMVRLIRRRGLGTAVVSASGNCEAVLESTGIADLFDVMVEGKLAARLGLPGKPAPDTFLEAARRLAVEPPRAIVVEDALSGVRAGRDGGFGLVIGVDRKGDPESLKKNGAHIVVGDLGELVLLNGKAEGDGE